MNPRMFFGFCFDFLAANAMVFKHIFSLFEYWDNKTPSFIPKPINYTFQENNLASEYVPYTPVNTSIKDISQVSKKSHS